MYATPKRSALVSGLLHAAAIVAVLTLGGVKNPSVIWKPVIMVGRDIGRYLASLPREKVGGGGGGTRSATVASRGRLPRAARRQFTPPLVSDRVR
jgi:hypothetical protein